VSGVSKRPVYVRASAPLSTICFSIACRWHAQYQRYRYSDDAQAHAEPERATAWFRDLYRYLNEELLLHCWEELNIAEWIKSSRHVLLREFFAALNLRLLGHYRYYGVRGNSRSLYRYFEWVKQCVFKWLNRRGGKRGSLSWARFAYLLELAGIAQPRITESRWAEAMP
jgi:hypothetical protein